MATVVNEKLAVLVDADNAQASIVQELLAEISRYGTATVKRAYGDWTTQNLVGWKDVLHRFAIQPIQQFRYRTGKNATDCALIIDAMDLLYSARIGGFCLVSSDSDFTRLATRIRETGLLVYGFGERKTPHAFVAACDKFIFTEVLRAQPLVAPDVEAGSAVPPLHPMIQAAVEVCARDNGWAPLSTVGSLMPKNTQPSTLATTAFKSSASLYANSTTSKSRSFQRTMARTSFICTFA